MPAEFLWLLLRRLALLMGAYLLLRLGFYVANASIFQEAELTALLLAFWHGFRFDMSALLLLNVPVIVLSLVPSRGQVWQRMLRAVWLLLNGFGVALNLIDTEYFRFIGRRTSNELVTIGDDVRRQAGQLLLNYWYLLIPFGLLLLALWRLYPLPKPLPAPTGPLPAAKSRTTIALIFGAQLVLLAGLVVLGIRGGLQLKPLRTGHAFGQQPAVLGHLALNSTFTFLKSIDAQTIERKTYFRSPAELRQALAARPLPPAAAPPTADNVVILLLESFASEYTGVENSGQTGYTPFFDSLATHGGVLFREHYANGRRSIEALPATLAGLPGLMDNSFITSSFQTNELHGLGELLGQRGYATSVFHGAQNGTMGFNTFSGIAGIQQYYGLDEYPGGAKSPDYDGHWGVFDEPYLQYFNRELSRKKEPFFSTVFTLSAHEPFTLPGEYKGKFPAGTLPIQPTIAYTDYALRRFFAAAARQPWYRRTLFVLLADHTSQSDNPAYLNTLGAYKTPLLLFHPGRTLPAANVHRITQQADVPATVLDVLDVPVPASRLLPFGYSAFDAGTMGRALFLSGGSYFLVHADFVTELTADNKVRLYPYQTHFIPAKPLLNPDPQKLQQYGNELKACVQFFTAGLLDNTLYR
ncbi:LTA synthase family protein [Hymenobacter sediminicola]|uniref:LTA synthase family protein n=1 Tax=Hymenobacter sediminicola TaxID=2761579 RepID=A0A7G7W3M4_9BACT|nr:LTA synthase family protein [Hymenobacter sediminicola]QNH60967.1 LTA synthase family protein [Hymenobacter sediminicola]